jgi:hypothetical protein
MTVSCGKQGVEIQLGLAIENVKASVAVKRRLACEQVKYWLQVNPLFSLKPYIYIYIYISTVKLCGCIHF